MLKRIGLFLLTNLCVLAVISIVFSVLSAFGIRFDGAGYGGLLMMCAVMGFVGSFISLALSKWMALRATGAKVITEPRTQDEIWIVSTVRELAQGAQIGMPDVAIYDAPDANAFATGMKRNSALVAVSTGLLQKMNREEVKAVLAHEISHVANGDMVTLTLIQGVVNTFVMFFARIVGSIIDRNVLGNQEGRGLGYYASVFVLDMLFGILASVVVAWFSRKREFRADAGAGRLYSKKAMISALNALRQPSKETELPKEIRAFGISGNSKVMQLFATHPSIDDRIKALQ